MILCSRVIRKLKSKGHEICMSKKDTELPLTCFLCYSCAQDMGPRGQKLELQRETGEWKSIFPTEELQLAYWTPEERFLPLKQNIISENTAVLLRPFQHGKFPLSKCSAFPHRTIRLRLLSSVPQGEKQSQGSYPSI